MKLKSGDVSIIWGDDMFGIYKPYMYVQTSKAWNNPKTSKHKGIRKSDSHLTRKMRHVLPRGMR